MSELVRKHVVKGAIGTSHLVNGTPCQDSWGSRDLGEILIVAISDGAGSAKYSERGSRLVVDQALDFFADEFAHVSDASDVVGALDRDTGENALYEIRHSLVSAARALETTIHEMASTLLVGIFHSSRSVFYQIGDGVWCVSINGIVGAATWPDQGEFVGQTEFVTSPNALAALQFSRVNGQIDHAVGMTDGLERLSLDFAARIPHSGFIDPLVGALRSAPDMAVMEASLERFLKSEKICERTDDDKTLAVISYAEGF
jgi:serine/threonine protein phosphatase PrpC